MTKADPGSPEGAAESAFLDWCERFCISPELMRDTTQRRPAIAYYRHRIRTEMLKDGHRPQDIAAAMWCDESVVCRSFHRMTGMSITEWHEGTA